MSACSIATNSFDHEQAFDFLRPSVLAHPLALFDIVDKSLAVPDFELVRALSLEQMTASTSVSCQDGTVHFYIRSIPVPSHTLGVLLGTWDVQGYRNEEMEIWRQHIDSLGIVWLRYVGQCKHPTLPWDRHVDDLETRDSGFLKRFYEDMEAVGFDAEKYTKVYEMASARVPPGEPIEISDDRERILVHLLDHPKLLNQDCGGLYPSYEPLQADKDIFVAMKTTVFASLDKDGASAPGPLVASIRGWATSLSEEAERRRYRYSPDYQRVRTDQATPRHQVHGQVVLGMIGKDVTHQHLHHPDYFLGDSCRAGYITRMFLQTLKVLEGGSSVVPSTWAPFVDLMPFGQWQTNEEFDRQQLEAWYQVVKPLVVVSFSTKVTGLLLDRVGSMERFWQVAGVPVMRTFGDSPVVVIPLVHPGRDKYDPDSPLLRRMMFLSWAAVLGACHEALVAVQQGIQDRKELCRLVVDGFDSPRFEALRLALASAKTDWLDSLKDARQDSRMANAREFQDPTSRKKTAILRMATSPVAFPMPDRKEQLEDLWRRHDHRLTHHVQSKEEFIEWGMEVPEDKNLYASALRDKNSQNPFHPNRACLRGVAPSGVVDDTWMLDPELVEAANMRKKDQLKSGWTEDNFSSKNQALRRGSNLDQNWGVHERIHGQWYRVQECGSFKMRWRRPNGVTETYYMRVHASYKFQIVIADFSKDGLKFKSADGSFVKCGWGLKRDFLMTPEAMSKRPNGGDWLFDAYELEMKQVEA